MEGLDAECGVDFCGGESLVIEFRQPPQHRNTEYPAEMFTETENTIMKTPYSKSSVRLLKIQVLHVDYDSYDRNCRSLTVQIW